MKIQFTLRLLSGASRRTSMLYEHETRSTADSSDTQQVRDILADICRSSDARPSTPELFSRLVYALRALDTTALRQVQVLVDGGSVCYNNQQLDKYAQ